MDKLTHQVDVDFRVSKSFRGATLTHGNVTIHSYRRHLLDQIDGPVGIHLLRYYGEAGIAVVIFFPSL